MSSENDSVSVISEPQILGGDVDDNREVRIKLYDFKRPDKFSKDQIRTITIMHETLARLTTAALSAQLRCPAHVRVAAVDQLTYEEFIRSIPNPTTLGIVHMPPLKGSAILEIDPAVTFATIDRLFGGQGQGLPFKRDLSEVEMSVMEEIITRILSNMREAWSTVVDLQPRLGQIETNPQFAMIVPPAEMAVLVCFETKVGDGEGMMNLCIPYVTIEPIISRLSAQYWYSSVRKGSEGRETPPGYASELQVDAELCTGAGSLSLYEVGTLRRGSMVPMDDWHSGRGFLRSGSVRTLSLRLKELKRRVASFSVQNSGISARERSVITGIDRSELAKEMDERMSGPVSILKQELQDGFGQLRKRIDELANRQDELSDHVFLSEDAPHKRLPHLDEQAAVHHGSSFDFIHADDGDLLLALLSVEHPQLVALVLANIEPAVASHVLQRLDEELQIDVTERIYRLARIAPQVLDTVRRIFERKFSQLSETEKLEAGGHTKVVEILNLVSRSTEKHIVGSLDERAPEVSEDIKQHMFVFEDIVLLGGRAVAAVVESASRDDLVLALRGVPQEVSDHLLGNTPPADREYIERAKQEMGPAILSDVEAAQQRIVAVIGRLESEGLIRIARVGEDEIVE